MTKVHPKSSSSPIISPAAASGGRPKSPLSLTVWKKSLLFNCNGFTVFDANGDLVFRVDNYMEGHKGQILLMDAQGSPLFTIRRKRLSFGDNWLVYDGETAVNPRFSVRKHVNILSGKSLAYVTVGNGNKEVVFEVEGSYAQRCCAIYDERKRCVAEIKRKEAAGGVGLGIDVFRLIVQPEIESALAMALVILLEQMFGSSRRLSGS